MASSSRKKYGQYLWDATCAVPVRSKHRFKKKAAASINEDDDSGQQLLLEASLPADMAEEVAPHDGSTARDAATDTVNAVTDAVSVPSDSVGDVASATAGNTSDSSDGTDDEACASLRKDRDEVVGETSTESSYLDQLIYPGARITAGESILMVMAHSLRHNSSKEATESMLKVIEAHLPKETAFPTTKYKFFKHFAGADNARTRHFYCPACRGYIGDVDRASARVSCKGCNKVHKVSILTKKCSYFFTVDLGAQLVHLLEDVGSLPPKEPLAYDCGDITQSQAYHDLPLRADDVTLTFNTDGVPLFESSQCSIWPLLATVNELPFKDRTQRVLLAGLWFGQKKPAMNTFFLPFVLTMNELSTKGVVWTDSTGENKTTRVFPGPCSVDSVARADVMCMTQFNGAYGCAWCEQRGEVVQKGKGHCRVYPAPKSALKMRTPDSFLKYSHKAKTEPKNVSRGVKAVSILSMLAFFSFSSGFVVDYMHAVCSGFVKSTMMIWLHSERCKLFPLRRNRSKVSAQLLAMQPPWEMSRLPRGLSEVKHWKSSEWRAWLLFYSPVILKGNLPSKFYRNWMKLVDIMHYLLGPSISIEKLRVVKKRMLSFVSEYQKLYGKQFMSYNAHLLLHLVDTVQAWGPLWGYSLYPFESVNGILTKTVCGTRYAEVQIVQKFAIAQALPRLWQQAARKNGGGGCISTTFQELVKGYRLKQLCIQVGEILLFGKGTRRDNATHYRKMKIGIYRFCTSSLDKSRRCNSFVAADGIFGRIQDIFVVCRDGHTRCECHQRDVSVELQLFVEKQSILGIVCEGSSVHFVQVEASGRSVVVCARSITKCMAVDDGTSTFLFPLTDQITLEAM